MQFGLYCLLVDKIDYRGRSPENVLSSSVSVMFQNYFSHQDNPYGKLWSYCSFSPSNNESLYEAVDWLKDYARRFEENPVFLNDFDEYTDHFSDPVEFPLRLLGKGSIDWTKLQYYNKPNPTSTRFALTGEVQIAETSFTNIDKSFVANAFSKINDEYGEDIARALLQIAEFVEKSGDYAIGKLLDDFNKELLEQKPQKDKLQSIWSGIERINPAAAQMTDAVSRLMLLLK